MIFFTTEEFFYSVIYAVGFGIAFSAVSSFVSIIISLFRILPSFFSEILNYSCFFDLVKIGASTLNNRKKKSATSVFLKVFAFSLLFVLLSYVALDGVIRAYLLVVFFASFYVSNFAFSYAFYFLLSCFLTILFTLIAIPVRLIYMIVNRATKG